MLFLCVTALALIFDIPLVRRLTGAELLTLASLPYGLWRLPRVRLSPPEVQFFLVLALWMGGAVVSDLYRGTPADDVMRGWSKIAFVGINFLFMATVVGKDLRRVTVFIFCLYLASVIRLAAGISDENGGLGTDVFGTAWKFGYGQFWTLCCLLMSAGLLTSPFTRLFGMGLPAAAALVNLLLNARNLFGISAVAAAATIMTANQKRGLSRTAIGVIALCFLVLGPSLVAVYGYAAEAGYLGDQAREKYELQNSGELGLLLGGRQESLASTQAILDSPILGHGSWARDISYVLLLKARLEMAGVEIQGDLLSSDLIPSHSHLFGAWVESGVFGALFWLWALWITLRGLYAALRRPTPLTGFIVFLGASLAWDIFFSPFGLERRIVTPACLYLMMIALASRPAEPAARLIAPAAPARPR